ncbi:hypothetical protein FVE85_1756 [Porphyridium purpureum]|uniref:Uncharacterized protein n=1 Tax=Porphyridium purpureum TaxID=35688 RepID=A0A5J4YVS2_PORPP|nr:hypothetical protein FVE85_1756 [Porphyridium purpureum]|eukprot:POR8077..scf209_3
MKNGIRIGWLILSLGIVLLVSSKQTIAAPVMYPLSTLRIVDRVDVTASCLQNNGTHCTCSKKDYFPLEVEGDRTCRVMPKKNGYSCGCPGTELCEVQTFECDKPSSSVSSTLMSAGALVECSLESGASCAKAEPSGDSSVCNKFVNVYIDGVKSGCIRAVPVDVSVNEAYGYQDAKATSIDTVELDFMNVRMVRTIQDEELHFCAIYGNWQIGEDLYLEADKNEFNRRVKSWVTASYPLNIEIMDDPADFYSGDGTKDIKTEHTFYVYKSDGFCLGPLLGDGSGIRAHFYDVNKMFGVNVQTYDENNDKIANLGKWYWKDHVGNPATDLDRTGRADGDEQVTVEFKPTCFCDL